ncbi:MAG: hypothetical protein CMP10_15055 [Zetaproteobacteria bacterium]|nr:hypothetical protein [Pseudobdellovibrionaceae bacterium]
MELTGETNLAEPELGEDNTEPTDKNLLEVPDFEEINFDDLKIDAELLATIKDLGWTKPTPVQSMCLPLTTKGKDVAGFAQTGTGKTAVFLISIAAKILETKHTARTNEIRGVGAPFAVILAPTRELAIQIDNDAKELLQKVGISSLAVYGGVDYDKQAGLIRKGVDVIVATPGRLKDYFQKRVVTLEHCDQFVCDEADRMFDMGFIEDVEFFLEKLNEKNQKLLFSATTNEQVKELAFEYLENPEYISVTPEVITPDNITQELFICESTQKIQVLLGLIQEQKPKCSIVFTNTKMVADWLHYKLNKNGIEADLITGDLPQKKRINLIQKIKRGEIKSLVATDVASRGLHIADVTHVYNFDLPDEAAAYVHRIGRTARAGAKGTAVSLVCEDYGHNLEPIKELLGEKIELVSTWFNPEFLKIDDKSGNPYQDPDFKGVTFAKKEKEAAPRSRDRNKKPESNRTGPQSRNKKDYKGSNRDDRKTRNPGRKEDDRKKRDPRKENDYKKKSKHKRSPNKDNRRPKNSQGHKNQNRRDPKSTAAEQTPSSVGGMVKKLVSVIFGRKKK